MQSKLKPKKKNNNFANLHKLPNLNLLFTVMLLSVCGLLMIFSASAVIAYINYSGDTFFFFKRQLIWLIVGSIVGYILYLLPLNYLRKLSLILIIGAIFLMIIMLPEALSPTNESGIPAIDLPFVKTINGATRWIDLVFFDLQPAEFIKFAFIIYIAAWLTKPLDKIKEKVDSKRKDIIVISLMSLNILIFGVLIALNVEILLLAFFGLLSLPTIVYGLKLIYNTANASESALYLSKTYIPFLFLLGFISVLILAQRDLDTTIILGITILAIFYAANKNQIHSFAISATTSLMFGAGLIALYIEAYRKSRLDTFWHILRFGEPDINDKLGAGFQVYNGLVALGSGGFWGLGYGESRQKLFYLQEAAYTDSIFAVIGEEFGFLGAVLVILGFLYFASLGFGIAKNAPDNFQSLLAVGMTSWIIIQAFLNIAANLSIIPFGGMPLPFFTYGGSSTITILMAVGVLLNISKNQDNRK